MEKKNKIFCKSCKEESWLKKEPLYDENFKKCGEKLSCASCGYVYASPADVQYIEKKLPEMFSAADRERKIEIFNKDEETKNCRHCKYYIVNPFTQRCGLHFRKVEATDVCDDFSPRKEK